MLESSFGTFWYLNTIWTRSPVGTRNALRRDPGSPSLRRHPTFCKNINRGRNPSRGVLVQLGLKYQKSPKLGSSISY